MFHDMRYFTKMLVLQLTNATTNMAPIAAATNAPIMNGTILLAVIPTDEFAPALPALPLSKLLDSHPSLDHPSGDHPSVQTTQFSAPSSQASAHSGTSSQE
jgi:hypothetical protein